MFCFQSIGVYFEPNFLAPLPTDYCPLLAAALQLFRPATEDLILTKMMRVDPQDRDDIRFLLAHLSLDSADAESLIQEAQVPAIPEIEEAFRLNAAWLRKELHRR